MLNYYKQFSLFYGFYISFKTSKKYDRRHIKKETYEKYKQIFPYERFEEYAEKRYKFLVFCLFVKEGNESFYSMIEKLANFNEKECKELKISLKNYRVNLIKDFKLLKEVSINEAITLMLQDKVEIYSLYYYLYLKNELESLKNSRIYKKIYKKLKFVGMHIVISKKLLVKLKNIL